MPDQASLVPACASAVHGIQWRRVPSSRDQEPAVGEDTGILDMRPEFDAVNRTWAVLYPGRRALWGHPERVWPVIHSHLKPPYGLTWLDNLACDRPIGNLSGHVLPFLLAASLGGVRAGCIYGVAHTMNQIRFAIDATTPTTTVTMMNVTVTGSALQLPHPRNTEGRIASSRSGIAANACSSPR